MGNKPNIFAPPEQKQPSKKNSLIEYKTQKLIPKTQAQCSSEETAKNPQEIILQQFRSTNLIHEQIYVHGSKRMTNMKVTKYFDQSADLQAYVTNILKLRKIVHIEIYDDLSYDALSVPAYVALTAQTSGYEILQKSRAIHQNLTNKMDLLIFVANLLSKVNNIYFTPSDLLQVVQGIYLINFEISEFSKQKIFIGFIRWLFGKDKDFQVCLNEEYSVIHGAPTPIQEMYQNLANETEKMDTCFLQQQLNYVKDKLIFLTGKIDSFYACSYFKKSQKFMAKKEWITTKRNHEVFFYHIDDCHACHGKVIRKRRKIDLTNLNIIFDPEQLEIVYIPENSKIIVRANEFDLQQYSSTSDIEIKYKLPVKFKNPLICMGNSQIFILEGFLYKYIPITNKLIQITRRIPDYIFLTTSKEHQYFIIKLSIDIFKNGIRVFYKNEDIVISLTGDKTIVDEISSLRIDIKSVNFCVEVYRGVYLMMASKNFWVLDMNFQCFFSYATPLRLKKVMRDQKGLSEISPSAMMFKIYNQPFSVDFFDCVDQNSVIATDKHLHILGRIQSQPFYLKYKFIHKMGAIKLIGYQPIFVSSFYKQLPKIKATYSTQQYHFNFHEQSLNTYKYGNWIFQGQSFLKVFDFSLKWEKTNYELLLTIESYTQTLKEFLQEIKKNQIIVHRREILVLLYKIYTIYEEIFSRSITHKNFSIHNLCFTKNGKLKAHGWCEPPRNWHISDFKDFLLTCFNIIALQNFEKLSEKIILKHEKILAEYPVFHEKLLNAIRQPKNIEKKTEIQKNLVQFKSYLQREISQIFNKGQSSEHIFSFEYKTPRFNMMSIKTQKMKKIVIVPEENSTEEFIFSETDKYEWSQARNSLYIFTTSFQFFQAKISTDNIAEEKVVLEDYEYLPNNIVESSFVCVGSELYSFGGVKKQVNSRSQYCTTIFCFNWSTLMWDSVGTLPEPRINPKITVSCDGTEIYVIGGLVDHEFPHFRSLSFSIADKKCSILVDRSISNPMSYLNPSSPLRIFHLNREMNLFMFWYMQEGDYLIRYLCCLSTGFNVVIRVKNFNQDNSISNLSVSYQENNVHILRIYGKYSRISLNNLESGSLKNETIYAI